MTAPTQHHCDHTHLVVGHELAYDGEVCVSHFLCDISGPVQRCQLPPPHIITTLTALTDGEVSGGRRVLGRWRGRLGHVLNVGDIDDLKGGKVKVQIRLKITLDPLTSPGKMRKLGPWCLRLMRAMSLGVVSNLTAMLLMVSLSMT